VTADFISVRIPMATPEYVMCENGGYLLHMLGKHNICFMYEQNSIGAKKAKIKT